MTTQENLYRLVAQIPRGRWIGYGDLGSCCETPISGLIVGRFMHQCPAGLPWWRVIGRDGTPLIAKLDAKLGLEQLQRLAEEGVEVREGRASAESRLTVEEFVTSVARKM